MSVDQFGIYATAATLAALTASVSLGGLDQLFLKGDISLERLQAAARRWLMVPIGVGLTLALVVPELRDEARFATVGLTVAVSLQNYCLVSLLPPQRQLQFGTRAYRELIIRLVTLALITCSAVAFAPSVAVATAATLTGSGVSLLLASLWIRNEHTSGSGRKPNNAGEGPPSVALARAALPYATSSALFLVNRQLPLLALILAAGPPEVAQFRAALITYVAAQMVPVALNNELVRPRLYSSDQGWARVLRTASWANASLGALLAVIAVGAAGLVVDLLFGADYQDSIAIMRICFLALPLFCLNNLFDAVLAASGNAGSMVRRLAVAIAATTLCCIALAHAGPTYLALAVPLSELTSLLVAFPAVRAVFRRRRETA